MAIDIHLILSLVTKTIKVSCAATSIKSSPTPNGNEISSNTFPCNKNNPPAELSVRTVQAGILYFANNAELNLKGPSNFTKSILYFANNTVQFLSSGRKAQSVGENIASWNALSNASKYPHGNS